MTARFKSLYGSSPLHLIALVASFALAAYAAKRLLGGSAPLQIVEWIVGGALLHDLVLVPLYSVLDRIAGRALSRGGAGTRPSGAVNYVRVPALLSGLFFLVYFPSILNLTSGGYEDTTGLDGSVYLGHWLLITAALFLVAGLAFAVHLRRRGAHPSAAHPEQGEPA